MSGNESTEAYDWFKDRYQSVYVSRNRWFVMAACLAAAVSLESLSLLMLTPLKTSVPFLIREENNGAVLTVQPLSGKDPVSYDESVRKYFIARYIEDRETYDPMDLLDHYRAVDLMSGPTERQTFHAAIVTSNPRSPITLYGDHTKRLVLIKSISFLSANSAQVRFNATEKRSGSPDQSSDWISTLTFKFDSPPAAEADRLVNPLGFQITGYRVDQEVLP